MLKYFSCLLFLPILLSCSKNNGTSSNGQNNGPPGNQNTGCVLNVISQINSGRGTESSLSAFYNSNFEIVKLVVYDSVNKRKQFEANLSYVTSDSIRIDSYQHLKLDGSKRVIRFVTKSNLADPGHADTYKFEYSYNSDGYLQSKNLFINGSLKPNFSTIYIYANQQLINCVMITPSAGNKKVIESTLSYDNNVTIKNWMYTFPDAMEGYPYLTVLNFGKRVANPLSKVVTKLYDPASGSLLDTWSTNYGDYKIDASGYLYYGVASGDLQQGMASFYGKTNFYYSCR